ncbi:MAG: endolytic transglycosylase MltG [Deltaproteobacteria bacterium]|nr:endolytic transglycosylase MltG [Deltaproteobacteria bacterium]
MVRKKRLLIYSISIFTLFSIMGLYFTYFLISPSSKENKEKIFVIKKGAGLKKVAADLKREGLIKNQYLFILMAVIKRECANIKAGEYSLNLLMSPIDIFNVLISGAVKTYSLTIPEGFTAEQIAHSLEAKALMNKEKFIELVTDKNVAASYNINGPGLEGYLFPDTYIISKDMEGRDLIDIMVRRFKRVFKEEVGRQESTEGQSLSEREIVTLASIVEKETASPEERPLIASVFLNRLKRGMRLESDPTVIYGLKEFDGDLTRKNLLTPNPYNTYIIYGLPPGPIGNPGRGSLKAAINPAKTNYLYFVSKNNGTHYFSGTLSEHNRAVYKYQKKKGVIKE